MTSFDSLIRYKSAVILKPSFDGKLIVLKSVILPNNALNLVSSLNFKSFLFLQLAKKNTTNNKDIKYFIIFFME